MKARLAALPLAFALAPLFAFAAPHPFNAHDLVMMDRVSGPHLSTDGSRVAFSVRSTDYAANKGVTSVWTLSLDKAGAKPRRATDPKLNASSGRFSPDGKILYFLATKGDGTQLWSMPAAGGKAHQITHLPVDVDNYRISPDGKALLFSAQVFEDCPDLACTKERLDGQEKDKATGRIYTRLFVRHWDTWSDHRRSQLFIMPLGGSGEPVRLTQGIDGDVPSKPFGDEGEYYFSPDGKTVYFDARIAGTTEARSTNFDIYSVPSDGSSRPRDLTADNPAWDTAPLPSHDGRTLYYLAMKTPGFEADRFAIMAMDLATGGKREIDPQWDRSPGGLSLSDDGNTLYATADDAGTHPLFAIDIASGNATQLFGGGTVGGFDVAGTASSRRGRISSIRTTCTKWMRVAATSRR